MDKPVFIFTADIDWASEYAIRDLLSTVTSYDIKPTVFVTHKSRILADYDRKGLVEVGIHPNFLPGSSQGTDMLSVIDTVFKLAPDAKCFRSHAFYDNSLIAEEMVERGIKYDSNLCLYLQDDLMPLKHWSGILRFPVFWEDDAHYKRHGHYDFGKYIADFFSPGLKVLNVHPFNFALNIAVESFYHDMKPHIKTLTEKECLKYRYEGRGTRTFVINMIESVIKRNLKFISLGEAYKNFQVADKGI